MKVTAILKNLSDAFYNGFTWDGEQRPGFLNIPDAEKFDVIRGQNCRDLGITIKIGHSNSFSERVDFNQLLRRPHKISFKIEPRRGYKLATFEFSEEGKI
jgi:hypothetical protein